MSDDEPRTSLWTDLHRTKPRVAGWIGRIVIYGSVHAMVDVSGFAIVQLARAPRDLAFGVIVVSVFVGFFAAQAAALLAREVLLS